MNKLVKQLHKAHQFAPYKHKAHDVKRWRKSWIHQQYINSSKPHVLAIAHAMMIDTAMAQKEAWQKKAEAIRFEFFDVWQDMDYTQRNAFLHRYLESTYHDFIGFIFEGEHIVVPFLNPLINILMVKRPAVFDLPQYFKLYKDFKEQCVDPIDLYGDALLTSGFYPFTLVFSQDSIRVFYDRQTHVLIVVDNNRYIETYPLYGTREDIAGYTILAQCIVNQEWDQFKSYGCEHAMFHPKLVRKWGKK